ncbi:hypothetical protein DRO69_09515 [Candidatus Bathyarchaeota archaeon]|nr:MAG: hypothetical protein DRO69_09515 [Candidatus Bathyarchaeota archaeon]
MVEAKLRDIIRPGTTRGLDFVILEELRKRTGIVPREVLKFALSEMLCNALDKEDATEIKIDLQTDGEFYRLAVSDNGSKKLTAQEVRMIFDFEKKASSKRGFLMVSRGYLGNALKCILGYSYALAESKGLKPPAILVKTANREYTVTLTVDRIREATKLRVVTKRRRDDCLTTFVVRFPKDLEQDLSVLKDVIFATSMVNPTRRITYNLLGEKGTLGSADSGKPLRRETSVLWYTQKQFLSLVKDFVKARPDTKLKEFISLFRGFTSKKVVGEILQKLNSSNHDSQGNGSVQFFPATPIKNLSEKKIIALFKVLKARSKPIGKRSIRSVLGCVGKDSFEKVRERYGWERLRYVMVSAVRVECVEFYCHGESCDSPDHVEFPYLVEVAVFGRKEDGEGVKVYQCVNFMASMEGVFSRIYDIPYHLGRAGVTKDTPVTVVAHLVCPVLKWLNYGKSALDE